jgi:hypothetical protein
MGAKLFGFEPEARGADGVDSGTKRFELAPGAVVVIVLQFASRCLLISDSCISFEHIGL